MKVRSARLAAILGFMVLFFGVAGYGQDVTMKYLSPLNPSVVWNNTAYAGIYNGQIDGAPAQIICDDFQDQIYPGENWKASVLNISALGNPASTQLFNSTMFGATIGASGYAQVAYLVSQMFTYGSSGKNQTLPTLQGVSGLTLADLSAVVWAITDPGFSGLSSRESNLLSAMQGLWTDTASAQVYLSEFSNLWLYTPDPNMHGGAQEMWSTLGAAEGGAGLLYLLLTAALCCGAVFFGKALIKAPKLP